MFREAEGGSSGGGGLMQGPPARTVSRLVIHGFRDSALVYVAGGLQPLPHLCEVTRAIGSFP